MCRWASTLTAIGARAPAAWDLVRSAENAAVTLHQALVLADGVGRSVGIWAHREYGFAWGMDTHGLLLALHGYPNQGPFTPRVYWYWEANLFMGLRAYGWLPLDLPGYLMVWRASGGRLAQ